MFCISLIHFHRPLYRYGNEVSLVLILLYSVLQSKCDLLLGRWTAQRCFVTVIWPVFSCNCELWLTVSFSDFHYTFLNRNFVTVCAVFLLFLTLSRLCIFNLVPSLFGAARSLHAGWDVWQLPPSGPWGPRAPFHPHQPLQHSQADHHPVSITMDDHHVWGEGHPAGDRDCPETGLTNLGSGGGLTCCRNK